MIDLAEADLAAVRALLASRVPGRAVCAFGSRVAGRAKPYSDLDLVVMGTEPLPMATLAALIDDFQESDLTFRVDVAEWSRLSPGMRAVVAAQGEAVQEAE